jgi:hypothetical protein
MVITPADRTPLRDSLDYEQQQHDEGNHDDLLTVCCLIVYPEHSGHKRLIVYPEHSAHKQVPIAYC